jgi:hypothetical protein
MKVKADRDESSPYAAMLAAQDCAVKCKVCERAWMCVCVDMNLCMRMSVCVSNFIVITCVAFACAGLCRNYTRLQKHTGTYSQADAHTFRRTHTLAESLRTRLHMSTQAHTHIHSIRTSTCTYAHTLTLTPLHSINANLHAHTRQICVHARENTHIHTLPHTIPHTHASTHMHTS